MHSTPVPRDGALGHIDTWVFDLDNTLYPAECQLFEQIDRRIGEFIAAQLEVASDEARRIQKSYFRNHGTTLRGLMTNHDIEPARFLRYVHDIDFSVLQPVDGLQAALAKLLGRKFIFTNADTPYAERIMERLGIREQFDAIYDIVAAGFVPKPFPAAYETLLTRHDIVPTKAVFVEDIARNLPPAAALGMTTVWLRNDGRWAPPDEDTPEPHYVTDDLVSWLEAAAGAGSGGA